MDVRCYGCSHNFDSEGRVPLVLKCGHNLCQPCVELSIAYQTLSYIADGFVASGTPTITSSSACGSATATSRALSTSSTPCGTAASCVLLRSSAASNCGILIVSCAVCPSATAIPAGVNLRECLEQNTALMSALPARAVHRVCVSCGNSNLRALFDCSHCFCTVCESCWDKVHPLTIQKALHKKLKCGSSDFGELPASIMCPTHAKKMDTFCKDDNLLLCRSCEVEHKGHDVISTEDDEFSHIPDMLQGTLNKKTDQITSALKSINDTITNVNKIHDDFETGVASATVRLQNLLLERRDQLISASQDVRNMHLSALSSQKSALEVLSQRVSDLKALQRKPGTSSLSVAQAFSSSMKSWNKSLLDLASDGSTFVDCDCSKVESEIHNFGNVVAGARPAPMPPPELVKATPNSLTLRWEKQHSPNPRSRITRYILSHAPSGSADFKEIFSGRKTQFTLLGLQGGTTHSFNIRAVNDIAHGTCSETVSFETPRGREFVFITPGDTNGVIYWIGTAKGTSPTFSVSNIASLVHTGWYPTHSRSKGPLAVLDHNFRGRNHTGHSQNAYWMVDLRSIFVMPTHYSLVCGSSSNKVMRSWELSGSVNGKTWIVLSTHNNDTSLQPNSLSHWALHVEQHAFSMFKVTQTGPNGGNNNALSIAGFEVYGTVLL
ncbi:tripartite motif-containing protein 9/67 [Pelomyxa schiedti]|nr:tripartite motif-containing protein 9/67 [Pelomyxa schiedti]